MFKRILAGIAVLAAALPLLLVIAPEAAAITDYDKKRVVSDPGTCARASGWGTSGSFAKAIASDSIVWRGRKHLHIYYSNAKAELRNCRTGSLEDGGKVKIYHRWTVEGTAVGQCEIGWGNMGCTAKDYAETATFATKWQTNPRGYRTSNQGADDIYARSTDTGVLDTYRHKVYVRFISASGNAETNTSVTNVMRYGHS